MLRRRAERTTFLAEIVPPRKLEESQGAARAMLAALAGAEPFSLETVITAEGPRFFARTSSERALVAVTSQLRAAYPQADIEVVPIAERSDRDHAVIGASEEAATIALRLEREPALPLRTDWRGQQDPLAGLLAAAPLGVGERVVLQLAIAPAPPRWADRLRARTEPVRYPRSEGREASAPASALPLVMLFALAAAGLQGYRWYEAGQLLPLIAAGAAGLVGVPLLALAAARLLRKPEPLPRDLLERKLTGPLSAVAMRVLAIGPGGHPPERLRALAGAIADAHRSFDDPTGNGLRAQRSKLGAGWLPPAKRMRDVLNAAELASLWHLPESGDAIQGVRRMRARRLAPPPSHAVRGCRVGVAQGAGAPVLMPEPLLYRNQLIVAKTRRGKSTLLRHLAADLMERILDDPDGAALVVVDPHQDLAEAVLRAVPAGLDERVVYLDMAHRDRPVGLNLLDIELFPDRDRATEHVITIMHRLWPDSWGPRMEGALRAAVASLMELNRSLPRERQHTLLDVAALLSNPDFRAQVLERVEDPALQAWWRDNFNRLNRTLQQQIVTPVTTKIGRFVVTEASRLVLGQARSTFDPRMTLRDGGVLVINTAAGSLGEGASALVGATLLNLIGLMVEEQVQLPPEQRRRIVVLVDESSTLGAVDYSRMLSELVKYGASFVLVTQGLAKLDAVDRSLVPTIFSNIDGLTVFQVSADDARRLTPELGSDLEVEDLTGLDDFECYARWWDGAARPAAFSFRVDPPPVAVAARMEAIAERSAMRFGRPRATVEGEVALTLEAQGTAQASGRRRKQSSPEEIAAATVDSVKSSGAQAHPVDAPRMPARGNRQRPRSSR